MATKDCARAAATSSASRSQKYSSSDTDSIVVPDFDATMNTVRARSSPASTARISSGSVVSSTWSSGAPGRRTARTISSAPRLEPPMPRSTTERTSRAATSDLNAASCARSQPAPGSSQPSQRSSSPPVHSAASRRHRRSLRAASRPSARAPERYALASSARQAAPSSDAPIVIHRHRPLDDRSLCYVPLPLETDLRFARALLFVLLVALAFYAGLLWRAAPAREAAPAEPRRRRRRCRRRSPAPPRSTPTSRRPSSSSAARRRRWSTSPPSRCAATSSP